MEKKTIYRGNEGFDELVKKVIQNGEQVHSDINEGLRVFLYDNKQYNVYDDIENGIYKYITIL